AAGLDDHLDLLEDAACLRLDVALAHEIAVLVVGQLARHVDGVAHAPAEGVARALVLHAGRSDRDACQDESSISRRPGRPCYDRAALAPLGAGCDSMCPFPAAYIIRHH